MRSIQLDDGNYYVHQPLYTIYASTTLQANINWIFYRKSIKIFIEYPEWNSYLPDAAKHWGSQANYTVACILIRRQFCPYEQWELRDEMS